MASIDEELLLDAEEDAREVEFIRAQLSNELKEKFSDDDILYFMDAIVEYYFTSGILDSEPDADGYVNIDLQQIAEAVAKKAAEEGHKGFTAEDVFFIVQADADFQDSFLEGN